MSNPIIARGRTRCFAWVEETATGTLKDHAADNYVRHEGADINFTTAEEQREDRCGSLAPDYMISKGQEAEWSYSENHLCPSGSIGGTSEFDGLLKALAGSVASVASTTVTGGTATAPIVASAANLEEGDIVYFATTGEAGQITNISTLTLTLDPPLSKTPTPTEVVVIGKQFRPATGSTAILTGSIFVDEDHSQKAGAGCPVNEGSISFTKGETVKASFSGPASGKRSYSGTTTLKTGVNDAITTFELNDGEARKFDVSGGSIYANIGTGVGLEIVLITAVDYIADTLTVTRNQKTSGAKAHLADVEISPWFATPTKTGNPVVGIAGGVAFNVDGERYVPKLQSATMTVNNNIVADSDYGYAYRNHFRRDGARPRSVSWEMEIRFDQDSQRIFGSAARKATVSACIWGGDTSGSIIAIGSQKIHLTIPSKSDAGGDDIILTLNGTALASAIDADDEFRIALL